MYTETYSDEVSQTDSPENLVNGVVGWQSAVEDVEMSFESLWNVVPAPSRVDHGTHHLDVHYTGKLTRLL